MTQNQAPVAVPAPTALATAPVRGNGLSAQGRNERGLFAKGNRIRQLSSVDPLWKAKCKRIMERSGWQELQYMVTHRTHPDQLRAIIWCGEMAYGKPKESVEWTDKRVLEIQSRMEVVLRDPVARAQLDALGERMASLPSADGEGVEPRPLGASPAPQLPQ